MGVYTLGFWEVAGDGSEYNSSGILSCALDNEIVNESRLVSCVSCVLAAWTRRRGTASSHLPDLDRRWKETDMAAK